nr:A disintegrin and metalloproteinase with thrombospondin motifs 18-like [Pocillopora verrucosa]
MTRKEILEYFGVSEHNEVPEYDVIIPYHSKESGKFVSLSLGQSRHRRSVGESEVTHYKLAAFGQELHVTLTRNGILMNHGLTVKTQNANGTMTSHPVPENTFYLGHVSSDPGSVVAVSELGGLTGIIRTSSDTLLVRPLPARLARHVTDNFKTLPHLVIKISVMPRLRQRRSLDSGVKKYLEAALVVLTDMEDKYGYNGTVQRLLVMANIVAGLFQDESIGATKIRYSINRILVLRPQELGIQSSDSNQLKLVRVIKWMRTQYGRQRPFDVVTFISNGPDRAVKSSANTMCRQVTASAVTDIGLGTAWYIAHGIGHNMGLDHDDDSADGADCPNYKYIMSSEKNTAPTSYMWSPCSRTRIQTFLNSGNRSWCLNDPPVLAHAPTLPPRNRGKLPGEIINGDQQCREAFSEDFKHASREKLRQDCGTLWCDNGKGTVLSADSRVADGTDCGVNKVKTVLFYITRQQQENKINGKERDATALWFVMNDI